MRRLRLRRITSSGRYLPEIDGLRFFCIAPIVLLHLIIRLDPNGTASWRHAPYYRVLATGFYGVNLFFIISGFVLILPYARARRDRSAQPNLGYYFMRRLTRLEPPYIVASIIGGLLAIHDGAAHGSNALAHLGAGLIYAHGLIFGTKNPLNTVTWSLEVEIQFYLLVPLIALIFTIRSVSLRRAVLVGTAVALQCLPRITGWDTAGLTLFSYTTYFAAGVLLADVYVNDWREQPLTTSAWQPVAPLALIAFIASVYSDTLGRLPIIGTVAAAAAPAALAYVLFVAAFRSELARRVVRIPVLTIIGGMCYTIYLVHDRVVATVARAMRPVLPSGLGPGLAVSIVPALVLVAACSLVFFVLIERPCMDPAWPRRILARHLRGEAPARS